MIFNVITTFPSTIKCFLNESIINRAIENNVININIINIRDYSKDKHKKVDDCPFGGGSGMLLTPDPIFRALESIERRGHVVFLSPMGQLLNQNKVRELAKIDTLTLICGHYEGVDQRVVDNLVNEEISIGDYILTGGEIAAAVIIDSITRELKDSLGNNESKLEESFDATGLLEYEQYTRPANYRGYKVPEILISGNHKEIEKWKIKRRLINTFKRRPELLKKSLLKPDYKKILKEIEEDIKP